MKRYQRWFTFYLQLDYDKHSLALKHGSTTITYPHDQRETPQNHPHAIPVIAS
ncbi:hypothetical protein [Pontibacillus yanchengensis]|uniref:hypothetical protein n=1 Tax=Pontibacillus yanchengensis TaxID=462910 RepID=UPI001F31A489|nr:hypothetical protein [Pontibacillus yanchengensis]